MASELFYLSKKEMSVADAFLNKGFLWGEAPFTTMYARRGKIVFKDLHFLRIKKTLEYLGEEDIQSRVGELEKVLEELLEQMSSLESTYIRITFFSELDGSVEYFVWALDRSQGIAPLKLKVYKSDPDGDKPLFLKSGDYSYKFKKRDEARAEGFDDVLFINPKKHVLDTSVANLFYVKDSVVFSSELIPGILDGICRAKVIQFLNESDLSFKEKAFDLAKLKQADFVFVTNAFSGIRVISQIDEKEFKIEEALKFRDKFNSWVGDVWPKI